MGSKDRAQREAKKPKKSKKPAPGVTPTFQLAEHKQRPPSAEPPPPRT